jgi:antitoxin ParD1/3/4
MSLNVSLTPQLEKLVKDKVNSGRYLSSSEVIREGLRLLDERDRMADERFKALKREVQLGVEQADRGETTPFDPEYYKSIIRTARKKNANS